ncbi:hypothetical protein EX30DRAFT_386757 [Ascodesmis nigricans]|uniref:Uncharacterized protein n=1 Tax=Ascodesmis nigricans TaxID=341454 RepID=A0A4S2N072_9PEZI|nr:hypothetical protein EX30DRAFT_386757 [Ascodesmis nigricans]
MSPRLGTHRRYQRDPTVPPCLPAPPCCLNRPATPHFPLPQFPSSSSLSPTHPSSSQSRCPIPPTPLPTPPQTQPQQKIQAPAMASNNGPSTTSPANTDQKDRHFSTASSIYSPDLGALSWRQSNDVSGERPLTAPAAVAGDPAAATTAPMSPMSPFQRPRSQSFTSAQSTPFMMTPQAGGLSPAPVQKSPVPQRSHSKAHHTKSPSLAGLGSPRQLDQKAEDADDEDEDSTVPVVPWSLSPHRSPVPTHLTETDYSKARPKSRPSVKSIIASIRESNETGLGLVVSPTLSEKGQFEMSANLGRPSNDSSTPRPESTDFFSDKIPIAYEPSEPSLIPVETEVEHKSPPPGPPPVHRPRVSSNPSAGLWNSSMTSLTSLPTRSATAASRHPGVPIPPPRSRSTPPVLVVPAQRRPNPWPRTESANNSRVTSPVSGHFEFRFSNRVVFHKGMVPKVSKLDNPDRNFTVELEGDVSQPEVPMSPRSPPPATMRRRSQQLPSTEPTIPEGSMVPRRSMSSSSWQHSEHTTGNSERTTVTEYQTSIEEEPDSYYYAADRWKPALENDLVTLWNNAQGSPPMQGDGRTYSLNTFPRFTPDPLGYGPPLEDFGFGISGGSPFYTLRSACIEPTCNAPGSCRTHDQKHCSGVAIYRNQPFDADVNEHICKLKLPTSGKAASDGLVTIIDPQRAIKLAMQALNPTIQTAMRAGTAVNLTLRPESCSIVWSKSNRHYELIHPKLAPMQGCPSPLVFEITRGRVGFGDVTAAGTLKLINTINKETLVTLDFANSLLTVDTNATSKVESEHIVDVAIVATLAVATCEGRLARFGLKQGASSGSSHATLSRYDSTSTTASLQRTPKLPMSIHHKSPTHRRSHSDHTYHVFKHYNLFNPRHHHHRRRRDHDPQPYYPQYLSPHAPTYSETGSTSPGDPNSRFSSDEEEAQSTRTWSLKSKHTGSSASSFSRINHKKKVHRAQEEAKVRLEQMRRLESLSTTGGTNSGEWPKSALSPPPERTLYQQEMVVKKQNVVVKWLLLVWMPLVLLWERLMLLITAKKAEKKAVVVQSGSMA